MYIHIAEALLDIEYRLQEIITDINNVKEHALSLANTCDCDLDAVCEESGEDGN